MLNNACNYAKVTCCSYSTRLQLKLYSVKAMDGFQTSQCKMQTADCRLQTADYRLQTRGKMQTEGKIKH